MDAESFSDVEQTVLETNQAFYDAHEHKDLPAMEALWERSDRVTCVHPGWPILRGWSAVLQSWRQIFAGPGHNQFILTNLSVSVEGDIAWVTVDENLVDGAASGTIAATNMFARSGDQWRLIVHHGSPVMG